MIPIHKEGRAIVAITVLLLVAVLALAAFLLSSWLNLLLQLLAIAILVLVLRFFRVPARRPFLEESTVCSPADGKVVVIERVENQAFMGGPCMQISIFMSIHNVHINYVPIDGKVSYLKYYPGKYLLARHPKSSELNERWSTGIETAYGRIMLTQIAGYVARRIRNYCSDKEELKQGNELGFIRFGSRVDVFLPLNAAIKVELGEKVYGGISPLARLN